MELKSVISLNEKVTDFNSPLSLTPSQRLRHPSEPTPPDPVLRRRPFPRLPPHELRRELRLHLHLVGQAAEDRQPVQQVCAETGRQEGAVNQSRLRSYTTGLPGRGSEPYGHTASTQTVLLFLSVHSNTHTR